MPPVFVFATDHTRSAAARHRGGISDGLVRRVADDADAHHPRHSYQQNSLHTEPGELAADGNNVIHHGLRNVVAKFPIGPLAGPGATAAAVLADPDADSAQLCEPHTSDQSLAAAEEVDLDARIAAPAMPHPTQFR